MMSCPENIESLGLEKRSRFSRFTFIPVLRGKASTTLSNRIVKALEMSQFCSSSPLIKKLIVQNVQVCCIVIETSGTQSVKVICASLPYLLKLLGKANPKFKKILEDEKVKEYFNFFKETDMESLLNSLCAATVIIQKGVKMCYPTLCIQLSRDALLFSEFTLKSVLNMFYNGLLYAFHFIREDLGPTFQLLCTQNRAAVKYCAKKLPVLALAGAKGLILLSLLIRRVIQAVLRTFKRSARSLCHLLQCSSIDSTMYGIFERSQKILKHVMKLVLSGRMYQYCKYYCVTITKWFATHAKDLFPIIQKELSGIIKSSAPIIEKSIHSALQSVATFLSPNGGLIKFLKLCYNSKPVFLQFIKFCQKHSLKIYKFLLFVRILVSDTGRFIYPHCKNVFLYLLQKFIYCFNLIIHYGSTIGFTIRNFLLASCKSYSIAKDLCYDALNFLNFIRRLFSKLMLIALRYVCLSIPKFKNRSLTIRNEISVCLFPTVNELNSTAICLSNEVFDKSLSGVKKVVPSVWNALKIVTPATFYATQEILLTSKSSVSVMYPVLLDAAVTIRPELSEGLLVVLGDVNKAIVEVVTVYGAASYQVAAVAKNVSYQMPVVIKAGKEVTIVAYYAVGEIRHSSLKARARVFKDIKRSVSLVSSSIKEAEIELLDTLDEVKYVIPNPSEVLRVLYKLAKHSSLFVNKIGKLFYPVLLKLLRGIIAYNINYIYGARNSLKSKNTLKLHLKDHLMQILNIITICFKHLFKNMPYSDNFNDKFASVMKILFSFICDIVKHVDKCVCNTCCGVLHNFIPKSWSFLKCTVSVLWQYFCDNTNKSWILLEILSSKTWDFIYKNLPDVWEVTKHCCENSWKLTCKVSPDLWNYLQSSAPVLWDYNRQLIKNMWNIHLDTCIHTWNVVVPLTSTAWEFALDNSPDMWLTISENSKSNWELFCYLAEQSWETVSDTSFTSWDIFQKIITTTWRYGIRPATVSACHNTNSVLIKSAKLSQKACAKTEKFMVFISDGLTGTTVLLSKFEEKSVVTADIFKKCIEFSREKLSKPNSKRLFLFNTVKKLVDVPSQISERCSNYLTFDHFFRELAPRRNIRGNELDNQRALSVVEWGGLLGDGAISADHCSCSS
ncbi:uncharacterized protein CDAR_446191 [Caerostris darwini]|uniref:Uncharacterized protein n=1 Tax=Caerostris darwini TaxID=1538125 RepID=A0AAV4U8I1_9ARAC|nr:uncharacterized protein CDAR_446191 [Caerostris darwini]